jgi:hypothetical protein
MKKIIKQNSGLLQEVFIFIILCALVFGCTPKIEPTIKYKTKTDTIYQTKVETILNQKDSMDYLHALNQVINLPKKVKKNSVITVIQGNDNKSNIDKSETNQKAKDNSAIGQDNQLTKTTKKNNWWWIFLAGALSWFIVQNVLLRILKTYFPIFKFLP